jgi:hypothetical protein
VSLASVDLVPVEGSSLELASLLAASRATDGFKRDVRAFASGGSAPRIRTIAGDPPVKVMRLLTQLLEMQSELGIERVWIDGWSGCHSYSGVVEVEAEGVLRRFAFSWDCRWRAEQEGWRDRFGLPDQARAVRELGWRCFARWEAIPAASPRAGAASAARGAAGSAS